LSELKDAAASSRGHSPPLSKTVAWRQRQLAAGRCQLCGHKRDNPKLKTCHTCRQKQRLYDKQRASIRGSEYQRARNRGLCTKCYRNPSPDGIICSSCKPRVYSIAKQHRLRLRQEVIAHYGGRCACCGESNLHFLQIDHIDNDGARHRRADPSAIKIYSWLKVHNFPSGFQVLCANCNSSKGHYGFCPHQQKEAA